MDLLLAAILFAAPAPQATAAQEAWEEWRASLGTRLATPITLDLEMDCSITLEGFGTDELPDLAWLDGAKFAMRMQTAMLDLHRLQIGVEFRGKLPDFDDDAVLMEVEAKAGFNADGSVIHAWGDLNFGSDAERIKGGVRVTQKEIEEIYATILTRLPELMEVSGEVATSSLMNTVMQYYPEEFGAYFHPANYLSQSAKLISVRKFTHKEDRIQIEARLDPEQGPLAEVIKSLEDLAAETEDAVGMETAKTMRKFLDRIELRFELDASTGVALAGRIAATLPTELFELPVQGTIGILIRFEASEFSTASFSAERLAPPAEGFDWMDGDPQLVLLRRLFEPMAEIPLITPSLPPPPPDY